MPSSLRSMAPSNLTLCFFLNRLAMPASVPLLVLFSLPGVTSPTLHFLHFHLSSTQAQLKHLLWKAFPMLLSSGLPPQCAYPHCLCESRWLCHMWWNYLLPYLSLHKTTPSLPASYSKDVSNHHQMLSPWFRVWQSRFLSEYWMKNNRVQ